MSSLNGPSEHLTWKELACKDGTPYPSEWRTNRAIKLGRAFELVRARCGNKPIKILSAYRTFAWNKKVGGAANSQHMEGRALDMLPPSGLTVEQFHTIVKLVALDVGLIGGIGKYTTFVHMDVRPRPVNNKVAYWKGTGVKDSGTNV